jgi:tetratricopeptide (TPR) repeat protein
MDNDVLFDKIEAYINNALSPAEKKAFEADIANDDDLATAVQMHRLEHDGMERILETDLRQKMKQWETEVPQPPDEKVEQIFPKPRFRKRIVLAVLSLLTLFVVYFVLLKPAPKVEPIKNEPIKYDPTGKRLTPQVIDTGKTPIVSNESTPSVSKPEKPIIKDNNEQITKKDDVIVQNNTPQTTETTDTHYLALAEEVYEEPSSSAIRGSSSANVLSDASDAFYDKNYQKAIDLLKSVPNTDAQYAKSLVITGHAYFKLKQYKKAIPAFQELIKIGKPYSEDAEWYLILCYLADYSKNKSLVDLGLKAILSNALHPHYKQAEGLQGKLK